MANCSLPSVHMLQITKLACTLSALVVLASCGGDPKSPPPPGPDFSVSASPVSASAVIGNVTSAVTISVSPERGFNNSVDITLQGLPQGVDSTPSSSFSLAPGASQSVTFSVSASATVGVFPITVLATSGSLSHSALLTLTTEPIVSVRTFQSGSLLYIESGAGPDIALVGLETQWGGSIVEVSLNGTNVVNLHDTGREIQAAQFDGNAQYDACAGCTGAFGWDPVQGGDKYNHGSPVLAQTVTNDALYVKAQGYQWNPDDKGGGSGQPVLGDTYVEASVSAVTSHAQTFRVHYKVTHFGADQHANSIQEFPAVYCNLEYGRFITYTGTAPWTAGELSFSTMSQLGQPSTRPYTPEHWGALVKDNDI